MTQPLLSSLLIVATFTCAVLGAVSSCTSNPDTDSTEKTRAGTRGETSGAASEAALDLAALPKLGTVDERFQSYNVEMAELTGGNFWKPYDQIGKPTPPPPANAPNQRSTPAGMDPKLYQYLPPIDLTQSRLRKLTAALGPA